MQDVRGRFCHTYSGNRELKSLKNLHLFLLASEFSGFLSSLFVSCSELIVEPKCYNKCHTLSISWSIEQQAVLVGQVDVHPGWLGHNSP